MSAAIVSGKKVPSPTVSTAKYSAAKYSAAKCNATLRWVHACAM